MAWSDNEIDKVIQILIDLRASLTSPSSGGATEATLQDLLTATQNIEIDADSVNLNTDQLEAISTSIVNNVKHKLNRIQGSTNYNAVITYVGATTNVNTITHTGTTDLGVETLIATYTYDGSDRVTNIAYS